MSTVAPSCHKTAGLIATTVRRKQQNMHSISVRRPHNSVWFAGLLPLLAFTMAALCSFAVDSQPRIHDEFSVLLGAETLMLGRLTNPVPDCWEAFQSFHIVCQPSYASKYPLGTAMITAIGWSIFGVPIAGTWLAAAIATASIYWMLRSKLAVDWAVLGTLLVGCNPILHHQWSAGWMHGWLPLAGAAIVLGALIRLKRKPSLLLATMLGVGISCLALTRPYEGLVFVVAASCLFIPLPEIDDWKHKLRHLWIVAFFAAIPVSMAFALTACHNLAVTGSVWKMPYQLHENTYGVAPLFVFGTPNDENARRNEAIGKQFQEYHSGWSLQCYEMRSTWTGWLSGFGIVAKSLCGWLLPLMLCCLLSITLLRYRFMQRLMLLVLVQVFAATLAVWIYPRYLSIAFPGLCLLGILTLRHYLRRTKYLPKLQFATISTSLIVLAISTAYSIPAGRSNWSHERASIIERLSNSPGKDLVIVEYSADHNCHDEWVYNQADIPAAEVLWARGENGRWHEQLTKHYGQDRTIWLFRPDDVDRPLLILSSTSEVASQSPKP